LSSPDDLVINVSTLGENAGQFGALDLPPLAARGARAAFSPGVSRPAY
jgi:hypothetical protein